MAQPILMNFLRSNFWAANANSGFVSKRFMQTARIATKYSRAHDLVVRKTRLWRFMHPAVCAQVAELKSVCVYKRLGSPGRLSARDMSWIRARVNAKVTGRMFGGAGPKVSRALRSRCSLSVRSGVRVPRIEQCNVRPSLSTLAFGLGAA